MRYEHGQLIKVDEKTSLLTIKSASGFRPFKFKKPKNMKTAREKILAVLIWRDPHNCEPIRLGELAKITGISIKNVYKIIKSEKLIHYRPFENIFVPFLVCEQLKRFYTLKKVMPLLIEIIKQIPKHWTLWVPEVRYHIMYELPEDICDDLMNRVIEEIGFEMVKRKLDYDY